MLERATASAEYTAHLFLRKIEQPVRSHRVLDASFWRHASCRHDGPAWWPAYLSTVRRSAQASRVSPDGGSIVSTHVPDIRGQQSRCRSSLHLQHSQTPQSLVSNARLYSNTVPRAGGVTTAEAASLVEEQSNDEVTYSPLVAPAAESRIPTADLTPAETKNESFVRDIGALYSEYAQPSPQKKEAATPPEEEFDRLWMLFGESQYRAAVASGVMHFLARSERRIHLKRALTAFNLIPKSLRSQDDYDVAVRVTVSLHNYREAVTLIKQAVREHKGDAVFYFFASYCVDKMIWNTLATLWDTMREARLVLGIIKRARLGLRSPNFAGRYAHLFDTVENFPAKVLNLAERLVEADAVIAARRESLIEICKRLAYVAVESMPVMNSITGEGLLSLLRIQQQLNFDSRLHLAALGTVEKLTERGARARHALHIYNDLRVTYPDAVVPPWAFGALLSICADARELPAIYFKLLGDFRTMHGQPDDRSFQTATRACAQQGEETALLRIFDYWSSAGRPTTTLDFNPLIYVYAVVGNTPSAEHQFKRIQDKFGVIPDVVNWTTLLLAYARSSDPESAFEVVDRMKEVGIEPNQYTWSILLSVIARKGDLNRTRQLYDQVTNSDVSVSSHMVGALVECMLQNNQTQQAEATVVRVTQTSQGKSTIRLWNILFRYYAFNDNGDAISRLQKMMMAAKIAPDGMTYAAFMTHLVSLGRTAEALRMLRTLYADRRIHPSEFHYSIIIYGFVRERNRDMATVIYEEMERRFPYVSTSARLAMLHLQLGRDKDETATVTEEKLRLTGHIADTIAFTDPIYALDFMEESLLIGSPTAITSKMPSPGFGRKSPRDDMEVIYFQTLVGFLQSKDDTDMSKTFLRQFQKLRLRSDLSPANAFDQLTLELQSAVSDQSWSQADQIWGDILKLTTDESLPMLSASKQYQSGTDDAESAANSDPSSVQLLNSDLHTFKSMIPTVPITQPDGRPRALPARRFALSRPLSIYMQGLDHQKRHEDIIDLAEALPEMGFDLSNMNWNRYVQVLSKSPSTIHRLVAFTAFEKNLLPMMPTWPALRRSWLASADSKSEAERFQRTYKTRPESLRPTYFTVIHLSAALMRASQAAAKGRDQEMRQIQRQAPGTFQAVQGTPFIPDRIQGLLLRGKMISGDAHKRSRAAPRDLDKSGVTGSATSGNVPPEVMAKLDDGSLLQDDDLRSPLVRSGNLRPLDVADVRSLPIKERLAHYVQQAEEAAKSNVYRSDMLTAAGSKVSVDLDVPTSDHAVAVLRHWISLGEQIDGEVIQTPIYLAGAGRLENASERRTRIRSEVLGRLDSVLGLRLQKARKNAARIAAAGESVIPLDKRIAERLGERSRRNVPHRSGKAKSLTKALRSSLMKPNRQHPQVKQDDKLVRPLSRQLRETPRVEWLAPQEVSSVDSRVVAREIPLRYSYPDKKAPNRALTHRQRNAFTINKTAKKRRQEEARELGQWHRLHQTARGERVKDMAVEMAATRLRGAEKQESLEEGAARNRADRLLLSRAARRGWG